MSRGKGVKHAQFTSAKVLGSMMCIIAVGLVIFSVMVPTISASNTKNGVYQARGTDAYTIGVQAYIYGLAPVIMQRTEMASTMTPGPGHAPINQFGHIGRLATPDDNLIVTPNSDTIYSQAWLELGDGPIILHVPDMQGRYYLMQMLDAYTNSFAGVGRRTTGTGEGDFVIAGPGWNGTAPAGMNVINSPTNTVWIIGRILVSGPGDLANATSLQEQLKLTPLSQYENPSSPPGPENLSDFKKFTPSANVSGNLTFFEELRVALKNNPPPAGEAALMAVFDRIGLRNNGSPYGSGVDPAVSEGLTHALKDGDNIIKSAWTSKSGKVINGWSLALDIGTYGYDYLTRAVVAEGGLGANIPQEAVYPKAQTDSNGDTLNGAHKYIIHFALGNTPPTDAFWSLTPYNATTFMLVPNPIDRYSLGDHKPGLQYNSDGSLDIYVQHDMPAGEESNWLPVPDGDFYLVLRMYQPKPEVLDGTYQIPPVTRVS
jgi:hypothetical protein